MQIRTLASSELLALADRREPEAGCLEPFLLLNSLNGLSAAHFVAANGDGTYFDEGIDGESRSVTAAEFLRDYPDSLGAIWNVEVEDPETQNG